MVLALIWIHSAVSEHYQDASCARTNILEELPSLLYRNSKICAAIHAPLHAQQLYQHPMSLLKPWPHGKMGKIPLQ